jgi:hypothetical protein
VALTGCFRDLVRQRAAALDRYADWAAVHPTPLAPAGAVEAIGAALKLLHNDALERAIVEIVGVLEALNIDYMLILVWKPSSNVNERTVWRIWDSRASS